MDAKNRRKRLMDILTKAGGPVTGTALAKEMGVSRQIIVGDMAILRAAGVEVFATPQGYMLPSTTVPIAVTARMACRHGRDNLARELEIIVDNGGKVMDVIVDHPIYGEIKANLMLASRRDITDFVAKLEGAEPLSLITGGVHLHTVEAPSVEVMKRIEEELRTGGFLAD